jgi:hypothetical protein
MPVWQNACLAKCLFGQMPVWQNACLAKCWVDKMTLRHD